VLPAPDRGPTPGPGQTTLPEPENADGLMRTIDSARERLEKSIDKLDELDS